MKTTPDLSREFHPVPKPSKRVKESKVKKWNKGRSKIKELFKENGITECEVRLAICTPRSFLGFAHDDKRRFLSEDEIKDPHHVCLACQSCHQKIEALPREDMKKIIQGIVKNRGW